MAARKYISLGRLEKELEVACPTPASDRKKRTIYPYFCINRSDLNLPSDKVGKEFECEVKLFVKSKRVEKNPEEEKFEYEFEVRAMKMPEGKKAGNIQEQLEEGLSEEREKSAEKGA